VTASRRSLAEDYFHRARGRHRVLSALLKEQLHADVVREAQELVELALKGLLRKYGIDPPKVHDVGPTLLQYGSVFLEPLRSALPEVANISKRLRKEREVSFYGDEDMVPSETYGAEEATSAIADAGRVLELLASEFPG
jgi:hypothetical protein